MLENPDIQIPIIEEYRTKDPTNIGWICPRCGVSNAPWMSQCNCVAIVPPASGQEPQ